MSAPRRHSGNQMKHLVLRNTRVGFGKLLLTCFKSCNKYKEVLKLLASECTVSRSPLLQNRRQKEWKVVVPHVFGISWAYSHLVLTATLKGRTALSPFYRWGNWSSENTDFPNITQPVGRLGPGIQVCANPKPMMPFALYWTVAPSHVYLLAHSGRSESFTLYPSKTK